MGLVYGPSVGAQCMDPVYGQPVEEGGFTILPSLRDPPRAHPSYEDPLASPFYVHFATPLLCPNETIRKRKNRRQYYFWQPSGLLVPHTATDCHIPATDWLKYFCIYRLKCSKAISGIGMGLG